MSEFTTYTVGSRRFLTVDPILFVAANPAANDEPYIASLAPVFLRRVDIWRFALTVGFGSIVPADTETVDAVSTPGTRRNRGISAFRKSKRKRRK